MRFDLPQSVKKIMNTISTSGHKAYIVGGCVRDLLCGKVPHDYDITTDADPQTIKGLFKNTFDTGIKHGTVTVKEYGTTAEITTFRTESGYFDSRHPKSVSFVSDVTDDLARRDFTVNAMCYNETEGLIDCFGGEKDLKSKTLRAVGDAKTRFSEDALRILRLFRFAATLEFNIESQTLNAATECAPLLKNISAERIFTELEKTAMGRNAQAVCPLLKTNALEYYGIKNADLSSIKRLDSKGNLRIFAFLYLTCNDLNYTLDALKCSNKLKDYCFKMHHLITNDLSADKVSLKTALNFAGFDAVYDALNYIQSVFNLNISRQLLLLDEIIKNNEPYKLSQLAVSGSDLLNAGFSGKAVGEKLNFLLNCVIESPEQNSHGKLLNLLCN